MDMNECICEVTQTCVNCDSQEIEDLFYTYEQVDFMEEKLINDLFLVSKDESNIQYIIDPHESVQLLALSKNPCYISHIRNPTSIVQKFVIEADIALFSSIRNVDDKMIIYALKKSNGKILEFVKNPSDLVKKYCEKNGF